MLKKGFSSSFSSCLLLIVISLSFRPSQSPSYDLGCFCRIEKSGLFRSRRRSQDTCGSIIISHTRARAVQAVQWGNGQAKRRRAKISCACTRSRRQQPAKYCYVRKKSEEEALRCVTRSCFGKLDRFLVEKHFRWSM